MNKKVKTTKTFSLGSTSQIFLHQTKIWNGSIKKKKKKKKFERLSKMHHLSLLPFNAKRIGALLKLLILARRWPSWPHNDGDDGEKGGGVEGSEDDEDGFYLFGCPVLVTHTLFRCLYYSNPHCTSDPPLSLSISISIIFWMHSHGRNERNSVACNKQTSNETAQLNRTGSPATNKLCCGSMVPCSPDGHTVSLKLAVLATPRELFHIFAILDGTIDF